MEEQLVTVRRGGNRHEPIRGKTKMRKRFSTGAIALMLAGGTMGGAGLVAVASATTTHAVLAASSCDNDHVNNGNGNLGDPGNGGSHHGEDNGSGNLGDPGNGANHQCT
jgi:hypothetical protein